MTTNGGTQLAAARTGADRRGESCPEDAVTSSDLVTGLGSAGPENFAIRAYREDDRSTLVLTGELDLGSAPTFEDTVVRACADGASELVLELSQLEFIDATGLDAVLSAKTVCARRGCAVFLTPRQESDQRAFEPIRLADYLPFRRSSRVRPADPGLDNAVSGAQLISAWE
jgi:anti-sigma B factor antagonist